MVKIKVPASSANVGPGFDTLGMALNLYNSFEFEIIDSGLEINGCDETYCDENNLVYKSFKYTADYIGFKPKGLRIKIDSQIPLGRGLGSSAACVAGGVFGANFLYEKELSKEELFNIAVEIEGHPDNIAPVFYGGLTACIMEDGKPYCVNYKVSNDIKLCVLIPDFEVSTKQARKILPQEVAYSDCVFNISRTAVLIRALEEGNFNLITKALKDKIHEPYRKNLIHEYDNVCKICIDNGSNGIFISGSGPSLMNIYKNTDFTNLIKNDIMNLNNKWEIKMLEVDNEGIIIERMI